jgi:putative endonuclease
MTLIEYKYPAYVYLIECSDESIYTGYTTDLFRRISEHRKGIGSEWTKAHGFKIFTHINCPTVKTGYILEKMIKRLSREKKREMFRDDRLKDEYLQKAINRAKALQ